jgi:translocation and assembly module TamB
MLASLFVFTLGLLIVLTQTNFGREQVRLYSISRLAAQVNGTVEVARIRGNLLTGATLENVSIADRAGNVFLRAKEISLAYSLRSLISKRMFFDDVRLIEPVMLFDQPPGGEWNVVRIFPRDTAATDSIKGFGSWITLTDLTIVDGQVEVRAPWSPADTLPSERRDSVARAALAGRTRLNVVRMNGGYQSIMRFEDVDGRFPRIRLADPDSSDIVVNVAALDMIAYPFHPPAADVRELTGTLIVSEDSLLFRDITIALPATGIAGLATYVLDSGDLRAMFSASRLAFNDLRWIEPSLPRRGGGALKLDASRVSGVIAFAASDMNLRIDNASLQGRAGAELGDSVLLRDTDVRFSGVTTTLLEEFFPELLEVPESGSLAGHLAALGPPNALRVDGDIRFDGARSGASHVVVGGTIGTGHGLRMHSLNLRLAPVQVALVRQLAPDLPLAGTLTGRLVLNGSTESTVRANADVVHRESGDVSRLVGTGELTPPRFDVRLRALPLDLETAGRFAPGAQLRGTATGSIEARGTPELIAFGFNLEFPDAGTLVANGELDRRGREPAYRFIANADLTNTQRLSARVPPAAFAGAVSAEGRGFDLATMNTAVSADVRAIELDSVRFDTATIRVVAADGLLRVDTLAMRTGYAVGRAVGSFGLVPDRTGELTYTVEVDSLGGLSRWLPTAPDTLRIVPRPARVASEMVRARADSLRISRETEVQRTAVGYPPEPRLEFDTVPSIPRDSVAGKIAVNGTMSGNLSLFDLRGSATFEDLVLRGNAVQRGTAEFAVANAPTDQFTADLVANLRSVQTAGFAFDSLSTKATYGRSASSGAATIAVHQDDRREYRLAADFRLELDRKELILNDVLLRFDSTRWVSTRPGSVIWAGSGVELETIELRSDEKSRVFVDGRLPVEGEADLNVEIRGLQLADISALLQGDPRPRGILSLDAALAGNQHAPRFDGKLTLTDAALDSAKIPDLTATFRYADRTLAADTRLFDQNATFVAAQASLPIDLALKGREGPRLLDGPLSIDARADSLPLDIISEMSQAFAQVTGQASGQVSVRGTFSQPEMNGALRLNRGAASIVPAGIRFAGITGALAMTGDTIVVDSLVAYSGGGDIRVTGGIGVEDLRRPVLGFDLTLDDARILNNDNGRVLADARLAFNGPLNRVHVTGDARIVSGVIYVPEPDTKQRIDPDDPAVVVVGDTAHVRSNVLAPRNALLDNLVVDVQLAINRDTWVRNTDANVEIYTPPDLGALSVHVDPANNRFYLDGFVNTERGDYSFMGRRFQVSSGSVTFIGRENAEPLLQVTAEHEVRIPGREAMNIQVVIGGTPREPKLSLSSDTQPPLSESDLISYLAFGTSSSSLIQQKGSGLSGSSSGGDLVGNVAALATRQLTGIALDVLADEFQRDVARSLRADVFQITPADVPDELSFGNFGSVLKGTELETGKYLTPRTFFGLKLRPTLASPGLVFEYRTPRGFRWTTSFEPRYLPIQPTFERGGEAVTTSVFGAFFLREWRW